MNKEITEKIIKYMNEQFNVENIVLDEKTHLFYENGKQSLQISSIDFVKMILFVEQEFGIEYEFDTKLETLGDLIDLIVEKQAENK